MASLCNDPYGYRVLFQFAGQRRTLRLGRCPQSVANMVKGRLEALVACREYGVILDGPTIAWLKTIGPDLAKRLATLGLIEHRESVTVQDFARQWQVERKDTKRYTINNISAIVNALSSYFGDKEIGAVTPEDGERFRVSLANAGYAVATWSQYVKKARQVFAAAIQARHIDSNPFAGIRCPCAANPDRKRFIDRTTIDQLLSVIPSSHWRLVIALSRYGGLRCPSEHLNLRWQDIDWKAGRIKIAKHKTAEREIPLFPELRPFLEAHRENSDGSQLVITRARGGASNWRQLVLPFIRKAGLAEWPKLFHNLRASRETELAAEHPLAVAAEWIGNSALVAQRHYLVTRPEDFERASKVRQEKVTTPLAQNPARQSSSASSVECSESPTVQQKTQSPRAA